jgi:hypothetical protein
MTFLGATLGVTRTDKLGNENTRQRLPVYNINEKEDRIKWSEHIQRVQEDSTAR